MMDDISIKEREKYQAVKKGTKPSGRVHTKFLDGSGLL